MALTFPNIALIGCGKMGGALLRGWLEAGIPAARVRVLEPEGVPPGPVRHFREAGPLITMQPPAKIFIMAVKPQIMPEACAAVASAVAKDALVLSIAAGQTLASFESYFAPGQPVIRAMPNLPASVGKGMTVAVANSHASNEQKKQAGTLLRAVGMVKWIDDEAQMDAATAVSGSGPAYIFLLIETLTAAGEKAGLRPDLAVALARQTVIGAAALAERDSETDAPTLRQNVTSPGGTTEAALKILMEDGRLQTLFDEAIAAAAARGRELSR